MLGRLSMLIPLLAGLILGSAAGVWAQGTRKDDIVINARGFPQGGASVAICAQPAVTSTTPCSPLANVYSNPQLTQALVNPLTTDGLGNYSFYALPGKYTIQIYGTGITTKVIPDVALPNDPATPTFTSISSTSGITAVNLTLSGNLTVSGSVSVTLGLSAATVTLTNQSTPPGSPSTGTVVAYTKTADKKLYIKDDTGTETLIGGGGGATAGNLVYASPQAGATADLKIQAAMNALPATGGTVIVDMLGAQTVASDVFNAVTKNVHLWFTSGQYSFSANTTFPMNMTVEFSRGAQFVVPTGVTVTVLQPIAAGNYQIFSTTGTGKVKCAGAVGTGYYDATWWGAVEDTATDSTPAIKAAAQAAMDNEGGTVYLPETANIAGSQRYLIGTALVLPTGGFYVKVLLAGPLRVAAQITIQSNYTIAGLVGNFTRGGAGMRAPTMFVEGAVAFTGIMIRGSGVSTVRFENLDIEPQSGATGIQLDTESAGAVFSQLNISPDATSFGIIIRGGFDYLFDQCAFNANAGGTAKNPLQFLAATTMPRQVTVRQTRFTNHGILLDITGANAGPNLYEFSDILYESFLDDFFKFTATGNQQISNFKFSRVNMADSATQVGLVKIVTGGLNSQIGGFWFEDIGAFWYLDSDVALSNVVIVDGERASTSPTTTGPVLFKAGSQPPFYVRFGGGAAGTSPSTGISHFDASVPVHVTNSTDLHVDMATPAGLAATLAAGGTLTVGQAYFWVVTARDDLSKETVASNEVTLTPTTGNQTASLTWTAVTGAASYKIYRGTVAGGESVFFTSTTNSFSDTGTAGTGGSFPYFTAAAITRMDSTGFKPPSTTFANLGTPSNGVIAYCSDCTIANPCAGAGTGAIAKRLNGVWVCN